MYCTPPGFGELTSDAVEHRDRRQCRVGRHVAGRVRDATGNGASYVVSPGTLSVAHLSCNRCEQIEVLTEQCSEAEFITEVAAEGGSEGAESLRVCLAVARALDERLTASLQETAAPSRPATDPSDLVPLPMPQSEGDVSDGLGGEEAAVQEEADTSSDDELPVGEMDAAADAMAARQRRVDTFGASC